MKKICIITILCICLLTTSVYAKDMYVVKYNANNEIVSWSLVTQEYLDKFKGDPSNPASDKDAKVIDPKTFEKAKKYSKPVVTEKHKIMTELGITQEQLDKIKNL